MSTSNSVARIADACRCGQRETRSGSMKWPKDLCSQRRSVAVNAAIVCVIGKNFSDNK